MPKRRLTLDESKIICEKETDNIDVVDDNCSGMAANETNS